MSANDTLKNWLLTKTGSPIEAILNAAKTVGRVGGEQLPKMLHRTGQVAKGAVGAGITSAVGEMGLRTADNMYHGKMELGTPDWTGRQLGKLYSGITTATGLGAGLQSAARNSLQGFDENSTAQKALDAAANLSNPEVREALKQNALQIASESANRISENMGTSIGGTVGKGLGQGLATEVWGNLVHHPIPTIGGAMAATAGPLVAYDLMTKKRRQEEAERNKAILRYVVRHETGVQKQASILEGLKGISQSPFFRKFLYRPTGLNTDKARQVLEHAVGHGGITPKKLVDGAMDYPQTLFNNSISRNPVKGLLGASLVGGTAQMANESYTHPSKYTTAGPMFAEWGKDVLHAPAKFIENVELGAAHSMHDRLGDSRTVQKINEIANNLHGQPTANPLPPFREPGQENLPYQAPKFSLSADQKDYLSHHNFLEPLGIEPAPVDNRSGWQKAIPYLGAGAVLATPGAAYATYKHYANKKLNKDVERAGQLQSKVTDLNRLYEE